MSLPQSTLLKLAKLIIKIAEAEKKTEMVR